MATTSWTEADIAALEASIKKGVRTVQYQSGSVTYSSTAELLTLLDIMKREVAARATSRAWWPASSQGLFGGCDR
jgi:hypothetical protein